MSSSTVPLETISVINLEMIQGDDELYFVTIEVYNPITEKFEVFDLSLTSKIEFAIKDPITKALLYHTDDDVGGVTEAPYYANEITQTDPGNGLCTIEIPSAPSDLMPIATHRYDVQITKVSGGKKKTIVKGRMLVTDDVVP